MHATCSLCQPLSTTVDSTRPLVIWWSYINHSLHSFYKTHIQLSAWLESPCSTHSILSKVLGVARRAGDDKVNQLSIATYSYSKEKYRIRTLRCRLLHHLHHRQRSCRRWLAMLLMSSHSSNNSRSDPILMRLPYPTLCRSYLVKSVTGLVWLCAMPAERTTQVQLSARLESTCKFIAQSITQSILVRC